MCSTQTDHLFGKQKREAEASRTLNFHKSTLDKIISSCIHPLLCLIYFAAFGQCDRRECIVFDLAVSYLENAYSEANTASSV